MGARVGRSNGAVILVPGTLFRRSSSSVGLFSVRPRWFVE